jgi:chaperone LolA
MVGLLLLAAPACPGDMAAAAPAAPARTASAAPAAGDAVVAARALESRLAAVQGMVARFTQVVESPALPAPQIETGTLYLMRPGRMRWEYRTPPGKLAIADGTKTWLYLPEDRQVLSAPMPGADRDQGIGLLLGGSPDILAAFTPRWGPPRAPGGPPTLALRPRSADSAFDEVRVETDAGGFPSAIIVIDPLGGRVTYRLEAIRFEPRLDEALFRFTPPPGVEVQEAGP